MNDGKIIIDKIIEKAEADAKALLDAGQKEADAILQAAEEKARKEREAFRKNADAEAAKVRAKEISGAELQAKIALLKTKQGILEDVIAEAQKRLYTLPDTQYAEIIGGMLERLEESYGTEIIVAKKDKERLAAVIAEKGFVLSDETREIDGGFVVKNGDIEYNYSFQSIIMVEQEEIRQIAANILF